MNTAITTSRLTRQVFPLICGMVGPILFIIVFLIEEATRPGYNPWYYEVSDLSLGPDGWMQRLNFLVCGILIGIFGFTLRNAFKGDKRVIGASVLLVIFGLALVTAAIFAPDPPTGRFSSATHTLPGMIHIIAGTTAFSSVAAAAFTLSSFFAHKPMWRGWQIYAIVTGAVVCLSFISGIIPIILSKHGITVVSPNGLLQRIGIFAGWGWVSLLALRLFQQRTSTNQASTFTGSPEEMRVRG